MHHRGTDQAAGPALHQLRPAGRYTRAILPLQRADDLVPGPSRPQRSSSSRPRRRTGEFDVCRAARRGEAREIQPQTSPQQAIMGRHRLQRHSATVLRRQLAEPRDHLFPTEPRLPLHPAPTSLRDHPSAASRSPALASFASAPPRRIRTELPLSLDINAAFPRSRIPPRRRAPRAARAAPHRSFPLPAQHRYLAHPGRRPAPGRRPRHAAPNRSSHLAPGLPSP